MPIIYHEFGRTIIKKYSGAGRVVSRVSDKRDVVTDSLILNAAHAGSALRRICARSGECDRRAAGESWGEVDLDLVDQALIQSLAENVATAFDQHTRDFVRSEFAEQIAQADVAINSGKFCEAIGENAGRGRQLPRTRDDNAPRLFRSGFSPNGQPWIIGANCFRTDQDGIDACA